MPIGSDLLAVNGNCRYTISVFDLDCDDQSTTTGALSNSNVQFTQETFSNWIVYSDQDANYAIRE